MPLHAIIMLLQEYQKILNYANTKVKLEKYINIDVWGD